MLFGKKFLAIAYLILSNLCFFTHVIAMEQKVDNFSSEEKQPNFCYRITHPRTWQDQELRNVGAGCIGAGAVVTLCGIAILIGSPFATVAAGISAGMKAAIPTLVAGGLCGFCVEGSGIACVHCGRIILESTEPHRPASIIMNKDNL